MTDAKLPTSRELESAVLEVLNSHSGALTNEQIAKRVIVLLMISPDLQSIMHSNSRSELDYRLAWARTRASKKKLIFRIAPKTWEAAPSTI